ncbi:MAG: MFS transporter [Pseudomonadota bacterium]
MSAENSAVRPPARRIDGPEAWFRLVIAVILGTVGAVGMWAVVVVLPSVQAEFGVDRADASMPYTATMVGFALGNFIVGRYVDRLGITIPVIAAALMLGSGLVLAAYTTDIWQFTIIQGVLVGLGTSATFGPLMASISHWFERRRGIAVAAAASGNYLAGTIWPIFVQQSVATEGWRTTYIAIGIICVLVMIPLSLLLRGKPPESPTATTDHAMSLAGPRISAGFSPTTLQVLLIIAGISCCVAMSMPQVHIVAYCVDLGYGPAAGAEMLSIMLGAGVLSRLISGMIADYIGGVKTVILGSVLQCIALTLFLPFDGLVSLYVVSLLFGLSQGGIVPSYAIIVREYLPANEAGQRVGLVVMSTVLGMAIGGWMSGWIFDQTGSYAMAFFNGIAWNVLNISIMLMLLWRARRPQGVAA